MIKHQIMEHEGREPSFTMKIVKFYRTPLARQVAEAIRIRRRGGEGAILNSKGEFSRCHIPRLRLEDGEPEEERIKRVKAEEQRQEELAALD